MTSAVLLKLMTYFENINKNINGLMLLFIVN